MVDLYLKIKLIVSAIAFVTAAAYLVWKWKR
nr:MAG TPA: hypothetical protein [Caudoviricetes sp.]